MRKPRRTYEVYLNGEYKGQTWAVSEAQAINNVRHNTCGDYESQYGYESTWEAILKYPYDDDDYGEVTM